MNPDNIPIIEPTFVNISDQVQRVTPVITIDPDPSIMNNPNNYPEQPHSLLFNQFFPNSAISSQNYMIPNNVNHDINNNQISARRINHDQEMESNQPSILREFVSHKDEMLDPLEYVKTFPKHLQFPRQSSDTCGFATQLWNLLNWTQNNVMRMLNTGCGWVTDTEFFLVKNRFTIITNIKSNTLNFKLRQGRFNQTKKQQNQFSFWKSEMFSKYSTQEELISIDKRRMDDEIVTIADESLCALMSVSLAEIHLNCLDRSEIPATKKTVIKLWNSIIGQQGVFAIERNMFLSMLVNHLFSKLLQHNRENDSSKVEMDGSNMDLKQYVLSHKLDLKETIANMVSYVFIHQHPHTITLKDFFSFYAHFGPEDDILEKIHKLLCCSQDFDRWFQPEIQHFNTMKSITGSYSNTCDNCFVLKRNRKWTIHIYNQINTPVFKGYLIDEANKKFLTWHAVLEHMNAQASEGNIG